MRSAMLSEVNDVVIIFVIGTGKKVKVKKKEGRLKKRTREELAWRREATGQVRGDGQWSERT